MTSSSILLKFCNFFSIIFYCNNTNYEYAKFHVKSIFLSGFMPEGHYMSPVPWGMIREKYPWADRVKKIEPIQAKKNSRNIDGMEN